MKVAIAQYAPVWFDLSASTKRLEEIAREASIQNVSVLVFGETWLSGYPAWLDHCPEVALWDHEPTKEVFARMRRSSLVIGSAESQRIAALSEELSRSIVLGANEQGDFEGAADLLSRALDQAVACDAQPEAIEAYMRFAEVFIAQGHIAAAANAAQVAVNLSQDGGLSAANANARPILERTARARASVEGAQERRD